jgi:putative transposase
MKRKQFSPQQIIRILNEADTGATNIDLCRKYGISEQTFYNWRTKYGGMTINDARRLKVIEEENRKLKHLVADLSLDNQILKELLGKNF